MAGICLIHSERGVLGIVDDYGSNYQRFHAVDIAILFFIDVHLIILIYFLFFLFKDSRYVFPRYDLPQRKPRCALPGKPGKT